MSLWFKGLKTDQLGNIARPIKRSFKISTNSLDRRYINKQDIKTGDDEQVYYQIYKQNMSKEYNCGFIVLNVKTRSNLIFSQNTMLFFLILLLN